MNVDHVATLRQARGTRYPDPVEAAAFCERAGAHGITVHLREDRRHVQDRDVRILRETVKTVLNLEMAATDEMVAIAESIRPDLVTLVPERREERTTEGGLDAHGQRARLAAVKTQLDEAGIRLSLFIDPERAQVEAAAQIGARQRGAAHRRLLRGEVRGGAGRGADPARRGRQDRPPDRTGHGGGGGAWADRAQHRRAGGARAGGGRAQHRPRPDRRTPSSSVSTPPSRAM